MEVLGENTYINYVRFFISSTRSFFSFTKYQRIHKLQGNNLNNISGICADPNELSKKAFKVFDSNRDGKITKKVFLNS